MTTSENPKDPTLRVREYEVSVLPRDFEDGYNWALTVQYRGKGRWGVFAGGHYALNDHGGWDREFTDDWDDEEWVKTHRFREMVAIGLALAAVRSYKAYTQFGPMTANEWVEYKKTHFPE